MTDETLTFRKAERKKARARIALCAPAGGGKTHSALLMAKGLGGKIALIDTENGSAEMETGKPNIPDFDVMTLKPPFDPQKYIDAIKMAEMNDYEVIIIDSLSHAWSGSGGLLEKKDQIADASSSKNSYFAWRNVTPLHNQLIDAMLQSSSHIIGTMRTKTHYGTETDDRGKTVPVKLGLAPVQREGMDYEFTIVFDISQDKHIATCSKDRTSMFDNQQFVPTIETGKQIKDWLEGGADQHPTDEQTKIFNEQLTKVSMTKTEWEKKTGKKWDKLSEDQANSWIIAQTKKIAEINKQADTEVAKKQPPTSPNLPPSTQVNAKEVSSVVPEKNETPEPKIVKEEEVDEIIDNIDFSNQKPDPVTPSITEREREKEKLQEKIKKAIDYNK